MFNYSTYDNYFGTNSVSSNMPYSNMYANNTLNTNKRIGNIPGINVPKEDKNNGAKVAAGVIGTAAAIFLLFKGKGKIKNVFKAAKEAFQTKGFKATIKDTFNAAKDGVKNFFTKKSASASTAADDVVDAGKKVFSGAGDSFTTKTASKADDVLKLTSKTAKETAQDASKAAQNNAKKAAAKTGSEVDDVLKLTAGSPKTASKASEAVKKGLNLDSVIENLRKTNEHSIYDRYRGFNIMSKKEATKILTGKETATADELKKVYRDLCKKLHSDVGLKNSDNVLFSKLTKIFDIASK